MKKLLLFIIALLISVMGFSQNNGKESLLIKKPKHELRIERPPKSYSDMDWKEKQQFLQTLNKKEQTVPKQPNASKVMKQCLDSIVLPDEYKIAYTYDNKGQTILIVYYRTGVIKSNTWQEGMKSEYEYDTHGNVILDATYFWSDENNDWFLSNKEEFEYDNYGNQLVYILQLWNENILLGKFKKESTYDDEGNETTNIRYDWDSANNIWLMLYKGESEYDDYGNVLLYIDYEWVGGAWVEYYKIENTYNKDNNPISWFTYEKFGNEWQLVFKGEAEYDLYGNETLWIELVWDGSNWIEWTYSKTEYEYDISGNITLRIDYYSEIPWSKSEYEYNIKNNITMSASYGWDEEINTWIGWNKYEYEYADDTIIEPTTLIEYLWDYGNSNWLGNYKYTYTYDIAGNLIAQIRYSWESSNWVLNDKYEITIDLSYSITDLVIPSNFYMKNKILFVTNYYWDGVDFIEVYTETYYWSAKDIMDNISDRTPQKATITVYPNPTTGQLKIDNGELRIENVEIFDVFGRKILLSTCPLVNSSITSIDISHLPAGIYFLQIDGQIVKVLKQ